MNQLKEAERKASQLVQDARKARVERMKEAKVEAEQIIAAYRAEMEAVYQKALATHTGSSGAAGNELQMSTEADIRNMTKDFNSNKEAVEKMLIDFVCNVNVKAEKARAAA
mmetsp:Transcript_11210/g.17065  ORF Transcript_11210/g.17065 Transcript_11210/m.17065 type:complete len:111 (+) Transcript_11210:58-390(+)|eukprot:CAMPEP_0185018006 /NCGR_PEP_ID=MMETSP1103-20130426/857_1 /TAXON_ID=36769 /ORGANISM="Paraphysomonas bandaiensis, Strain Caron Lab Isolate" /LENGTH=110 /DNA_ID=CAMNT_0027547661 /DNA_START=47 /DNA_END=379 /DNA_ORIENTATION=-